MPKLDWCEKMTRLFVTRGPKLKRNGIKWVTSWEVAVDLPKLPEKFFTKEKYDIIDLYCIFFLYFCIYVEFFIGIQEYDFVFNVDIDDDKPPLKLPYNKSEDPWYAAQAFIHKHNLPQGYLERVAYFIIENSKQTQPAVQAPPPEFADPFTGK